MANEEEKTKSVDVGKILDGINFLVKKQKENEQRFDTLDKKIKFYETGRDERFKEEAKSEDIEKAKEGREKFDPRIVKLVDEILGEDFKIEIESNKDKPGFSFTLVIPTRLSLLPKDTRPIKNPTTGVYLKNRQGEPKVEEYQPEDRRSKQIASTDSFDAIRVHCEKVRANIVSTYQKLNRPLPEFKLKQNV